MITVEGSSLPQGSWVTELNLTNQQTKCHSSYQGIGGSFIVNGCDITYDVTALLKDVTLTNEMTHFRRGVSEVCLLENTLKQP